MNEKTTFGTYNYLAKNPYKRDPFTYGGESGKSGLDKHFGDRLLQHGKVIFKLQRASELLADLERALRGEPIQGNYAAQDCTLNALGHCNGCSEVEEFLSQ